MVSWLSLASILATSSGSTGFLPISSGGQGAFGGFVDPTVTRVEMVDGRTGVVDVDLPTEGATVFLAIPSGQIRYYRGGFIVGAVPVMGEAEPSPTEGVNKQGQEAADTFIEAMLSGGWEEAAPLFEPGTRAIAVLPPLEDVLTAEPHQLTGPPKVVRFALFYGLRRPSGPVTLQLSLTEQSGEWKVFSYGYRADSPLDEAE